MLFFHIDSKRKTIFLEKNKKLQTKIKIPTTLNFDELDLCYQF